MKTVLEDVERIVESSVDRTAKIAQIAEAIRTARAYRWVGIYDVSSETISIIAYSGPGAPAHPSFPVTAGLSGEAVRTRRTIVANDVTNDPRYLTAFTTTAAEIIVPIIATNGTVVGTLDAESETPDAFTEADRTTLEECANTIERLFARRD